MGRVYDEYLLTKDDVTYGKHYYLQGKAHLSVKDQTLGYASDNGTDIIITALCLSNNKRLHPTIISSIAMGYPQYQKTHSYAGRQTCIIQTSECEL